MADSCNNRELLARCPRHIQSVLVIVGILMDDHVMVKRQLSKRASTDQCHLPIIAGSSVQLVEMTCFFKVIRWPGLVL